MSHILQAGRLITKSANRDLRYLPLKEWDVLKEMVTNLKLCLITFKM